MGVLLAIFVVISLNLVPEGAPSLTIDNYVVEGVGIYPDATRFVLERTEASSWSMLNAQGEPWFVVAVQGPVISLTTATGETDTVDIGAAVGLPAEAWWEAASVAPPGASPLVIERLPNGFNVTLDGLRAAEVRW